jgi:hypothetical protein
MTTIVRLNELKVGDVFKRSERFQGTVTYRVIGYLTRSLAYKNEYNLKCEIVACTDKESHFYAIMNQETFVTSTIKYGRLGKVTKIN